uniref:hypothetical protein n=1 Tax=Ectobacillus panaciterrae TaxID=363872 RepID=UPI001B7FE9A2
MSNRTLTDKIIIPTTNNPLPTNLFFFFRESTPNTIKIIAKGTDINPKPIFKDYSIPSKNN